MILQFHFSAMYVQKYHYKKMVSSDKTQVLSYKRRYVH